MAGAAGTHRGEVVVEFGVSRGYRVRCEMGRVGWGAWVGCETVWVEAKDGQHVMDGQANDVAGGARTKVGQNITRVTMTTTTGESIGSQRRWFRCFPDALPGPPASRSDRARASKAVLDLDLLCLRCQSNGGAKARARTPPPGPTRLLPPRPGGLVGGTGRRRRRPPPLSEKKSRGKGNTCGVGSAGAQLRSSSSWVMSERCSNELMEVDRHPPLVCIVYARGVPHLEQSCAPQAALQTRKTVRPISCGK